MVSITYKSSPLDYENEHQHCNSGWIVAATGMGMACYAKSYAPLATVVGVYSHTRDVNRGE